MESELHPDQWSKLDRIRFLLDHWSDIFDPGVTSPAGIFGDGSGVPLMPMMSHHPSILELQRCLDALASWSPSAYRHLKAYRCNSEWRQVRAMVEIKLPSGRTDEIPGWRKERITPRWVSLSKVADAEAHLLATVRGEVFIPKELWDGLTKPIAV